MKNAILLGILLSANLPCQGSLTLDREIPYVSTSGPVPVWNGGALISIDKNDSSSPVIHVLRDDGTEASPYVFSVSEASLIRVYNATRTAEDGLALCGIMHDRDGHGSGYIAFVSADRQTTRVIRTFPYLPFLITAGTGGSLWTEGLEHVNGRTTDPLIDRSRGALRHFDSSGTIIASALPVASLTDLDLTGGGHLLASSKDRVGFYSWHALAYFEIGVDGKLNRFPAIPVGHAVGGLALTDDGGTYFSVSASSGDGALYRLDKAARTWQPVAFPDGIKPSEFVHLYGGDGNRLVLQLKRPVITFVTVGE